MEQVETWEEFIDASPLLLDVPIGAATQFEIAQAADAMINNGFRFGHA